MTRSTWLDCVHRRLALTAITLFTGDRGTGQPVRFIDLVSKPHQWNDSTYQPGERPLDWQKLKLELQQEFVVGGYRSDGEGRVDALLIGYYRNTQLVFAGKVRAGMVRHVRRELVKQLETSHVTECPFVNLPDLEAGRWGSGVTAEQMQEMTWIRPAVVVQVRFQEWTAEGRLRHGKYLGLRPDKEPNSVHREG